MSYSKIRTHFDVDELAAPFSFPGYFIFSPNSNLNFTVVTHKKWGSLKVPLFLAYGLFHLSGTAAIYHKFSLGTH